MKRLYLFLLCCLVGFSSVFADEYRFDVSGGDVVMSGDSLISTGVVFAPASVIITETIQIDNYGKIDSDFYICDCCDLYVKNAGDFSVDIHLGVNSKLIQVVNNSNDMNALYFDGGFDVLVENNSAIMLTDIVGFANGADKIVLKNSVLKIDGVVGANSQRVELVGEIKLIADDLSHFYGSPILTNVMGNGSVRIVNNNPDSLYADVVYVDNGALYVRRIRETDYVKVFKNDTGRFLNMLRDINPNDSLFDVLDVAPDMATLRSEMAKSVRFNSDMLVRPLNVLHAFDRLDFDMLSDSRFDASAFVIGSDNFYLCGLDFEFVGRVTERLNFWGGLRVGMLEYASDLDNYSGQIWGANFGARYTMKNNLFLRFNVGADVMNVDVGYVLYDDNVYTNPRTLSGVGTVDFGYVHNLCDGIYIEPFVGVNADYSRVENISEFNTDVIAGLGAGYSYALMGLRYDYIVRGVVSSNGEFGFTGRVGFWSEFDAVGGDVQISAMQMYDVMNYKLSLNTRMWF